QNQTSFTYVQDTYVYQSPATYYYGEHPIQYGGECFLVGRHSHPYDFGNQWRDSYSWNAGYNGYVYRGPPLQRRPQPQNAGWGSRSNPPRTGYTPPQASYTPPRPTQPQHQDHNWNGNGNGYTSPRPPPNSN